MTDVIVIGGGHNGLVTATLLARRGLKTVVLERRDEIGGAAITGEICPGFRVSTLAHSAHVSANLVNELGLSKHGLELIDPEPHLCVPFPDGRALVLGQRLDACAASIASFSQRDAQRYAEFSAVMRRIGKFVAGVLTMTPPDIERPSGGDLWQMLSMGRRFRGLGKQDAYRVLRWAPMSAADFAGEWFESEPLRAATAGPAVIGTALGPRSAGSTAVLLMKMAAGGGTPKLVRGGLGAFTSSLAAAARGAGAEIRANADVAAIDVHDGKAVGVTLRSGDTLRSHAVVSNADPRRTLLGLIDPIQLEPGFLARIRSYRSTGNVAKVNLALSRLPAFSSAGGDSRALAGVIQIGPTLDYLERAFDASKYGTYSPRPHMEITIPSLTDPSLAPAGAHVMSITAQFAPYRLRDGVEWAAAGEHFADAVIDVLSEYAPDLKGVIVQRDVITPVDLETRYGLTGGHIFHGELSLDQMFTMRPALSWARYRTPIAGLYLCGAGTHPGYGVSGLSGTNAAREILKDFASRDAAKGSRRAPPPER